MSRTVSRSASSRLNASRIDLPGPTAESGRAEQTACQREQRHRVYYLGRSRLGQLLYPAAPALALVAQRVQDFFLGEREFFVGRQPREEPSEIEALHRVARLFLVNVKKGFAHRAAVRCRAVIIRVIRYVLVHGNGGCP